MVWGQMIYMVRPSRFIYEMNQKSLEYLSEKFQKFSEKIENSVVIDNKKVKIENFNPFSIKSTVRTSNLKQQQNSKYKVGDIVWGWVKENHLNYEDNYVLTKVKIIMVNKFKSSDTYFGSQINRRWGEDEYSMKMQFVENVMRGIGCTLNDSMIVGLVDEIPMPEKAINHFIDKNGYLNESYSMTSQDCMK